MFSSTPSWRAPAGPDGGLSNSQCPKCCDLAGTLKRSARARREHYVGPWLPEPVVTDDQPDALARVELSEGLSLALMMVLENLGPAERAAFLLREAFDYGSDEISGIVGASRDNVRQMVSRARRRVRAERPRFAASEAERTRLLGRFMAACEGGDLDGLIALFSEDITLWSDGGGRVTAALNPIHGRDKVSRFLIGTLSKGPAGLDPRPTRLNGDPGLLVYLDGAPFATLSLDVDEGRIRGIAIVVNPDKLVRLPAPDRVG